MCAGPLDALPWHCLLWLDPASLLRVQVAGVRLGEDAEEQLWRHLCATELGVSSSRLSILGSVPRVPGRAAASSATVVDGKHHENKVDAPAWSGASRWRRVFYDLDVATTRNGLRHTSEDYEFFPSLHGEPAAAPEGVTFFSGGPGAWTPIPAGGHGEGPQDPARERVHRCRLVGPLGSDRCIVASAPLPGILSATALPAASGGSEDGPEWRVAYRPAGYFEVTLEQPAPEERCPTRAPSGLQPCVSVGLCTPRLSRHSARRKQAGWDAESWGLHGDDGHLFHGSSHGRPFQSTRSALFGAGDTVGCGVLHVTSAQLRDPDSRLRLTAARRANATQTHDAGSKRLAAAPSRHDDDAGILALGNSPRHIFFTLNGELLGSPFLVDDTPMNIPLWPCVGLDAPWMISFNFGERPFAFDLDLAMPPVDVQLRKAFETVEPWPHTPAAGDLDGEDAEAADAEAARRLLGEGGPEGPTELGAGSAGGDPYSSPRDSQGSSPTPWTMAAGAGHSPVMTPSGSDSSGRDSARRLSRAFRPVRRAAEAEVHEVRQLARRLTRGRSFNCMMPLTSKVTERPLLGAWASGPAQEAVRRYGSLPRWRDPVDRLVTAALVGGRDRLTWAEVRGRLMAPNGTVRAAPMRTPMTPMRGGALGTAAPRGRTAGVLWPLAGRGRLSRQRSLSSQTSTPAQLSDASMSPHGSGWSSGSSPERSPARAPGGRDVGPLSPLGQPDDGFWGSLGQQSIFGGLDFPQRPPSPGAQPYPAAPVRRQDARGAAERGLDQRSLVRILHSVLRERREGAPDGAAARAAEADAPGAADARGSDVDMEPAA